MTKGPHHSGDYQVRARAVRDAANRNPATRCWRCGRTLAEHPSQKNGKPPKWTAGHLVDGDPTSPLLPEVSSCNYRAGQALATKRRNAARAARRAANPDARRDRVVVLLCGPPGAGKTTAAKQSGLDLYDFDDPQWHHDQTAFNRALYQLSSDDSARAVAIRWCPRSTDRKRVAAQIGATHVWVMTGERNELARRIVARNRADKVGTLAALDGWFRQFDKADGVCEFPGWSVLTGAAATGATGYDWP